MRGRRWKAGITAVAASVALGLAGCGGTSTKGHAAAPASASPLHVYRVMLSGRAERHGAPTGVGVAIIAIHKGSVICWRFAHLHGFVNATAAHIHTGRRGSSGAVLVPLSTGPRLHHQGCTRAATSAVSAIVHDPGAHYVNVHSAAYPAGAVRGQL